MKIPEPVKLPSGRWRIQVTQDGKRISKTFKTKNEAVYWAAGIKTEQKRDYRPAQKMTLGEAIDRYIESNESVLSPSTIAGYKRVRSSNFAELMPIQLDRLDSDTVQRSVNALAKQKAAKTVCNAYGLISATLGTYYPELHLRVQLPRKQPTDIIVPTEADILAIMQAVKGHPVELPVMLALWMGLRMSEIRGLTWDCIEGDVLHIKQAKVDEGLKGTKTYHSDRRLRIPTYIQELLAKQPRESEFIVPRSRRTLYEAFQYHTRKAGIQHYRFHDLRHANASVMLMLNVPDKYAMVRMGHSTNNMLKTVYQHTIPEEQLRVADIVDAYFEKQIAHEIAHENQ